MLHQTVAKRFVERRKSSFVPTDPQMTIVILGACKVGKSAIVSQFLWQGIEENYRPTVEEFHWIEYDRDRDHLFTLQIIDSSGSHDFLAMRQLYYRTGDAFVIVFAVDDENSYAEAKEIVTQILEVREGVFPGAERIIQRTPIVLVANKGDKRPAWNDKEPPMLCNLWGINYALISAYNEDQVANVFKLLTDQLKSSSDVPLLSQLKKRRQSMPATSRGSGVSASDLARLREDNKKNCVII